MLTRAYFSLLNVKTNRTLGSTALIIVFTCFSKQHSNYKNWNDKCILWKWMCVWKLSPIWCFSPQRKQYTKILRKCRITQLWTLIMSLWYFLTFENKYLWRTKKETKKLIYSNSKIRIIVSLITTFINNKWHIKTLLRVNINGLCGHVSVSIKWWIYCRYKER